MFAYISIFLSVFVSLYYPSIYLSACPYTYLIIHSYICLYKVYVSTYVSAYISVLVCMYAFLAMTDIQNAHISILNSGRIPHTFNQLNPRAFSNPNTMDCLQQDTQYQYFYRIHDDTSGVELGHQESRKGHHTQGSYHVRLPDGRLQRVAYTVSGDSGFRARVFYEAAATRHSPETSVNTITSSYDLIPTLS